MSSGISVADAREVVAAWVAVQHAAAPGVRGASFTASITTLPGHDPPRRSARRAALNGARGMIVSGR